MERMNLAIIEFLSHTCNENIARTFYDELDDKPEFDFDEVYRRKSIRQAIEAGELDTALDLLNGYYPTKIIQYPDMHVDILVAQLVSSIRRGTDALDVVKVARTELVPVIERFPKPEDRQRHLDTLNKAMSLLIRADVDPSEVWSPQSIYVSLKELAHSIDTRLMEMSGTQPRSETLLMGQLVCIHSWAEKKEWEEREKRASL